MNNADTPSYQGYSLENKVALITGAASGIGLAIAHAMIHAGARVWIADLQEDRLAAAADQVGSPARYVQLDVSQATQWQAALQHITREDGTPDILVNNAGIGAVGTLLNTDMDTYDRLHSVNVRGVMLGCQTCAPSMIDRGSGSVINIASLGGVRAIPDRMAYCTTKFAVVGMTRCMAVDHAKTGVRFNCLCPGRVATPWVEQRIAESDNPETARQEMSQSQPIGRMIRPDEVASAAVYLASDEASSLTGVSLSIDGGWSAG